VATGSSSAPPSEWWVADVDVLPPVAVALLCGLLGLVVGSFLNVVIHRVPLGQSVVRPASACPGCGAAVRGRHNVPVIGWLVLRGRCADCHALISVRYPLVELGTGLAFAGLGWAFADSYVLPALLWLAAAGIALGVIDLDTRRLPDVIVGFSFVAVLGLLVVASAASGDWEPLGRAVLGAAASYALFRLLRLAWPAGMGGGDVKLAGLLGLVTAWLGWDALAVGVFAGFGLGAAVGAALMVTGRAGRRTALPFGPFLVVGAFVGVLAGAPLAGAYLDLVVGGAR
jgi:leader peptidase (prepilin peptidase)/N-methyltransferase